MAGKVEAMICPVRKVRTMVKVRLAWAMSRANEDEPRMDAQMTYLRPMRSPTGPPMRAPATVETIKPNSMIGEVLMITPNFSIRKKA
jgi:hypothetical protein